MWTLFRDGGWSMFFILGFGFVALGWAAWFAARGRATPLGFVKAMMAATLFATLSGVFSDLGTVFKVVWTMAEPDRTATMIEGLGECMAPGVMGFAFLALAALLVGVGSARVARAEAVD